MSVDDHLESALAEYNDRISRLESDGVSDELIEACINRGVILYMMESFIAARGDLDDAIGWIEDLEDEGAHVDAGLFIRAYEYRGLICRGSDNTQFAADFRRIASRLDELDQRTRYFSFKDVVDLCLNCANDLIGESKWPDAIPFCEKAIDILGSRTGIWEDNCRAEAHSIAAEAAEKTGKREEALRHICRSIDIGEFLYRNGDLEDMCQLALDHVCRGDMGSDSGDDDGFIDDYVRASQILENMLEKGMPCDSKVLVDVYQGIASTLVKNGRLAESEVYLLKAMKHGMPEIGDAIRDLGIQRRARALFLASSSSFMQDSMDSISSSISLSVLPMRMVVQRCLLDEKFPAM